MATTATPRSIEASLDSPALPVGPIRQIEQLLRRAQASCELELPGGETIAVGDPPHAFRLRFHTATPFSRGFDEKGIAESYMTGEFDIEGDMIAAFAVRHQLVDRVPASQFLRIWLAHLLRAHTSTNRNAIDFHYQLGDDFYVAFLDERYRIYTHGIYYDDNDLLEDAAEHKMERAFRGVGARPGMRVLDVGAGWGATERYFGSRGVHVTGLTIGADSRDFVQRLIDRERLTAEVRLEDFLLHRPSEPYDAVVVLGVIEHITDYRRFARQVWSCLTPGGRLYLDASASREKFTVGSFAREYIWTGTHTFLCLQDLVKELVYHGVDVVEVQNETRDYGLTCAEWGRRFDAAHDFIAERWGERLWRAWRLYLWGAAHAFLHNDLQAFHVIGQRDERPGPRPGVIRRAVNGIKSIV